MAQFVFILPILASTALLRGQIPAPVTPEIQGGREQAETANFKAASAFVWISIQHNCEKMSESKSKHRCRAEQIGI